MAGDHRIVSSGDACVSVEFEERIDPAVHEQVLSLVRAMQASSLEGIRDIVPTYRTVAVHFDPVRTDIEVLWETLDREASRSCGDVDPAPRVMRVPVCYGGEYGPDLELVARWAGLTIDDVIARHAAVRYRVYMLGFLPGFAYLGSVDPRIAAPRRDHPRSRVPRGAVGIAGAQTGIYPSETPGGWQIIGQTSIEPYNPLHPNPFLFEAGDAVEFYPT